MAKSHERQSSQLPRPDNLPADDEMVSLDIRCHFVPSVVLELVRRHVTAHHLHGAATLHRIRQGVVNVLPVVLRVRAIAPEHLHRLQPAGIRVAQEVPVGYAHPHPIRVALLEVPPHVVRFEHNAAVDANDALVLVDDVVQRLHGGLAEDDVVIDVVDVLRRHQQRHQEAQEERRVPVGRPHVLHRGPRPQQRLVVLVLRVLHDDDLTRLQRAARDGVQLALQPESLVLGEHDADGARLVIVGIAGEINHVVHPLALARNEVRGDIR